MYKDIKIYLSKDEIKSLQESGILLTRPQIIKKIFNKYGDDITDKLIIKYCDCRSDPVEHSSSCRIATKINHLIRLLSIAGGSIIFITNQETRAEHESAANKRLK